MKRILIILALSISTVSNGQIYSIVAGDSYSIGIKIDSSYDVSNMTNLRLNIGRESPYILRNKGVSDIQLDSTDNDYIFNAKLSSEYTSSMKYGNKMYVTVQTSDIGVKKTFIGSLNIVRSNSGFSDASTNEGFDLLVTLTVTPGTLSASSSWITLIKGGGVGDLTTRFIADSIRINEELDGKLNLTGGSISGELIMESTTDGFLPPRLTTDQRLAISTPTSGLMVYDTDDEFVYWYTNSWGWVNYVNSFTGWSDHIDTVYTEASPLFLSQDVKYTLPNGSQRKIDSQKPVDVVVFYNPDDTLITGRNGDGIGLTISFKVKPTTSAAPKITLTIDIGGSIGEIYPRDFILTKGNGVEHFFLTSFFAYTLDTWEANGGKIKIISTRDVEVYDIEYRFARTHKGR